MTAALDAGPPTLHIRCGSDLRPLLEEAGFLGEYLEWSDPLCQGPVLAREDWLTHRATFLTGAYGSFLNRDHDTIAEGLRQAERGLHGAAASHERVVLWFEHDSYDQLILARCLAAFGAARPRHLELVMVEDHPEPARFIGLGQLSPRAPRALWDRRQGVTDRQIAAGTRVWDALRAAEPSALAAIARAGMPDLPYMARALRRHCQEFPWRADGLGLTERLVLTLLSEQPHTMGMIFQEFQRGREKLPWLGDTMLRFILESMKRLDSPVFTGTREAGETPWYKERLTITDTGRAVLAGTTDYLSLHPPARFLGGVRIAAGEPVRRWDDRAGAFHRV